MTLSFLNQQQPKPRSLRNGLEWKRTSLREAGVRLIDCDHRTPPATSTGYPYVAIPQLKQGRIDLSDARRISAEHFSEWTRKAKPQEHDVILSRRCNPGETAHVPAGLNCALGQNLVLLRSDGSKVYPPFLRWLVRSPKWWEQVNTFINVGAVFDSLKCADIPNFRLPLPPLVEQKAIAAVLGTLDDKIELNLRMNATLEAIARALFQSWFVDFDPVRAKLDGGEPANLDKPTATLFPASFQDSEFGHVPRDWKVKPLGQIVELAYGKPLKGEDRKRGPVRVYGSNGLVGWHDEKLVSGPGIVVGRKGNPGVVTWAHSDFFPIDTTFYVVPTGDCHSFYFLYYALSNQDLANLSADSAVPGLNRNHAYMSKQVVPPSAVLSAFDSQVGPIFAAIEANDQQSRTLATVRDTLLPRLLSGELSISKGRA
jgi:type I restriction enzyme S subunit